ncbi:hypothetical protein [Novosphingobium naphthalenivorans]|uniref:hypothetical protein n=1 Tax=Novosphingobium naphthalenivorans TaxID=273168 RepID=UPI0012EDEAFD|nr:hypothetical protein [Novosphingobium naphthalenivorans]
MISKTDLSTWRRFTEKVMIDRVRFRQSDWLPHFTRLKRNASQIAAGLADIGSDEERLDPRLFLVWAWCVLMSMPDSWREAYTALREVGIEEEMERLRVDGLIMRGLDTVPDNRLRWLAALTRLIDDELASMDYWPEDPARWSPQQWQPGDYPCFVVPVKRSYRLQNGKEAEYRATRYHALVPSQVGELAIDLILTDDSTGDGESCVWTYGAAVFDDVTLTWREVGQDEFLLSGAPGPDACDAIEEQIRMAIADGCDVLTWPELTVPPDRLGEIRQALGSNPLGSPKRIPLVIAGSWHVEDKDGFVNRSEILQAGGRPLTHCDKRRRFEFMERKEAIVPTCRVPLIVMDDRLVAVAICLDFCDDRVPDLYADLGVDLVIVPSMGMENTTQAHERHAATLQSRHGGVTCLVQQHPYLSPEDQKSGNRGYSFASPPKSPSTSVQNVRYRKLTAKR